MNRKAKQKFGHTNRSHTPEELASVLAGLGATHRQLDGSRVKAPARLLHETGRETWFAIRVTPWTGHRLRIVAECCWGAYFCSIRRGGASSRAIEEAERRLKQASARCRLDVDDRWEIPPVLLDHLDLAGDNKSVVLVPDEFWLEAVSADTWERELEEALSLACQSKPITPVAESPSR